MLVPNYRQLRRDLRCSVDILRPFRDKIYPRCVRRQLTVTNEHLEKVKKATIKKPNPK